MAAFEVKQLKAQTLELERMLGRKTQENEILKEAVEIIREKDWSRPNCCSIAAPARAEAESMKASSSRSGPTLRWCPDSFEIRCWSGERVYVAFRLDCCGREVTGFVAASASLCGEHVRDMMVQAVDHRFGPAHD
ncbi:MAG TPA: hypothetical protein VGC79_36435 [Polyangiaceae bacterium]